MPMHDTERLCHGVHGDLTLQWCAMQTGCIPSGATGQKLYGLAARPRKTRLNQIALRPR